MIVQNIMRTSMRGYPLAWTAGLGFLLATTALAQPPARNAAPAMSEKDAAAAAELLEKAFNGAKPPESVRMLTAILRGSQLGPGEGWFGPAQTRYTWAWLSKQCGTDP